MSGHKGGRQKVHQRSHAHNPPSRCLIQRAGGNPEDLKGFNPIHFLPSPEEQSWLDEIVMALIPDFVNQHKIACQEYWPAKSHGERLQKRLTTVKGLLSSLVKDTEHFVMMAASPLVHPFTQLLNKLDTRSLWEIYHNSSGLAVLFNLPAFNLQAFKQLEKSILGKMVQANDCNSTLSGKSKCAMEKFVKDHVAGPMMRQHLENRNVMTHLEQERKMVVELLLKKKLLLKGWPL